MIPRPWKRAPADNGAADPNADVRPNRPANTILGAIRGLMATGAAARDDVTGELVAALGTSKANAYSVSSNEGLIDLATGINGVPAAITGPFLMRLAFDTTLAGSAANVPHLVVDGFDCGPILRRDGTALADGDLVKGVPVLVQGDMAAPADTKVTRARVLDLTAGDIQALTPSGIPVGALIDWPSTVTPDGYLDPVGALLSRASYPALWAFAQASGMLLSEAAWAANPGSFSVGDGATTFRCMDVRGEFFRVLDGGRGVDGGRGLGTSQAGQIQAHDHQAVTDGGLLFLGGGVQYFQNGIGQASYANGYRTGSTGGGETRPRNVAYRKLIRYK